MNLRNVRFVTGILLLVSLAAFIPDVQSATSTTDGTTITFTTETTTGGFMVHVYRFFSK